MVPIPGDFVAGVYHPWLDYKWGYAVGVPVKNPITADVPSFIYPMQILAVNLIAHKTLPLWNQYILGGTPLLANFQSAPASPTNFLYILTDRLTAWSIQVFLQHFLAGLFTYFLLRYWKVSKWGALFGGTIYAFSGFNVIWSQWNGHALSAAFIPLIILLVDRWLLSGKTKDGILISVSLFLIFLSGYPQVILYLAASLAVLWMVRLKKSKYFLQRTFWLVFFGLTGFGLAAFQLLPGAELLSLSQRAVEAHPFEWAFLPWSKIITFLAPDFFGNHATGNYWGPQDYTSNTGFVGAVAFLLAASGAILVRRKKEVLYLLVILAASLILAFPTPISILFWQKGFLGLNAASAHRSLVLFNLAAAALAGFGIDNLINKQSLPLRGKKLIDWKLFALPLLVLAGYGAWALSANNNVAVRNLVLPSAVFLASSLVLRLKKFFVPILFTLMCFELFYFGWKFTPFSPRHIVFPTTPVLDFLMAAEKPVRVVGSKVIPINMLMPYGVETIEGYDAVYPLRISKFLSAINESEIDSKNFRRYGIVDNLDSHLLDLVNSRYHIVVVVDGETPEVYRSPKYEKVFQDKSVSVFESTGALPRAFMVYDWEVVAEENEIIRKLQDDNFPLASKVLLEEEPRTIAKLSSGQDVKAEAKYLSYQAQGSKISVESGEDGLLFVSDTYYPGWEAFIDGAGTKIYRADFAFRAVEVPKGSHLVEFRYQPESFALGLKISVTSLLVLGAVAVILERRHV